MSEMRVHGAAKSRTHKATATGDADRRFIFPTRCTSSLQHTCTVAGRAMRCVRFGFCGGISCSKVPEPRMPNKYYETQENTFWIWVRLRFAVGHLGYPCCRDAAHFHAKRTTRPFGCLHKVYVDYTCGKAWHGSGVS